MRCCSRWGLLGVLHMRCLGGMRMALGRRMCFCGLEGILRVCWTRRTGLVFDTALHGTIVRTGISNKGSIGTAASSVLALSTAAVGGTR